MEQRPDTVYPGSDPRYHTANIKTALRDLIDHLREDANKIEAPKAQALFDHALFDPAAEVLIGFDTAFDHYERGTEPAVYEASQSPSTGFLQRC